MTKSQDGSQAGRDQAQTVADESGDDRCDVSIVVPAYGADRTLSACVDSLMQQSYLGILEVLVCASADTPDDLPQLPDRSGLRLIAHSPRMSAAAARNRAASEARGRGIAFTDADVLASEDWVQRLVDASAGDRCVAGSVLNGTRESLVGSAEYLLQFIDLHPNRNPNRVHFGATCNLFLPRVLWESVGPFPEDMDGGEDTIITARLRRQNLFVFEPGAVVYHLNRTRFTDFIRHQYEFGRFSARLARRPDRVAGTTIRQTLQAHAVLAPVAAVGKLGWIYFRVLTVDRTLFTTALRCTPFLWCGVAAWTSGLVAGCLERRSGNPGSGSLLEGSTHALRRRLSKR